MRTLWVLLQDLWPGTVWYFLRYAFEFFPLYFITLYLRIPALAASFARLNSASRARAKGENYDMNAARDRHAVNIAAHNIVVPQLPQADASSSARVLLVPHLPQASS